MVLTPDKTYSTAVDLDLQFAGTTNERTNEIFGCSGLVLPSLCGHCGPAVGRATFGSSVPPDPTEFQNPPKHYRPWTIWWWFGNASDEQDLAFELAEMDKVRNWGVQIFPVYPLSENDSEKRIQNVPLYSAEWKKRFAAVLQEAEKRDMKVMLLGGSGWPLGGPWVSQALSSKAVAHGVLDLQGPGEWVGDLPVPIADKIWSVDRLERLVMVEKQTGDATPRRVVIPLPRKTAHCA